MKSTDFITESTQMSLADGSPVAVKSSQGRGKPPLVTMLVSKKVWDAIKDEQANDEMMQYDIATAEMIIRDWKNKGAEVYWKTAADHNREARELEQHRFRNDPEVSGNFDNMIDKSRGDAKDTAAAGMQVVERVYTGEPLEKGGTSISGNAAPPVRDLLAKGIIKPGMTVLDFGAGKFARNANFLRDNGVKCYAYDPFNGTNADGWEQGVSKKLPSKGKFDLAFTAYVLNVVPEHVENELLGAISKHAKQQVHITRNMDIYDTVKKAIERKDKLVGNFFLTHYADDAQKQMFEEGTLPKEVIVDFCKFGVQTSKGFQRIPFLEQKGFTLIRKANGFKVYQN